MSIPSVKGVEIGPAFENTEKRGSEVHDEIFHDRLKGFFRKQNRAGGVEGGISNGEPIVVRLAVKPIPTLQKPLATVDIRTLEPAKASNPNMGRDYLSAYGLVVLPRPDGDDVLFKTDYNGRFLVVRVPNQGCTFDLDRATVLLDQNDIKPTATWETYFFSACFLGLFPSEGVEGGYDLVVPLSLEQRGTLDTADTEHLRHTFICLQDVE